MVSMGAAPAIDWLKISNAGEPFREYFRNAIVGRFGVTFDVNRREP
jgi:hypothetical protein